MADDDVLFARRLGVVSRMGEATATLGEADLSADVEGCPGWSVSDVCLHLGGVFHLWSGIARGDAEPTRMRPPDPPESPGDVGRWCAGLARGVVAALAEAGPTRPMWTPWGGADACDVAGRVAHESIVHGVDLAAAIGRPVSIDPADAADAIEDFCRVVLMRRREAMPGPGGSVHLHCTDTRGEWMIRERGDGTLEVSHEHAKGSCALRGDAVTLLLVLWRRLPVAAAEVFGSVAVAERFVEGTELG